MSKIPIKATPKLAKAPPKEPLSTLPTRMHRRLWLTAKMIGGFLIGFLGLVGSIYGIWGPPWPTDPDIQFQNALRDSSFILPFALKNKSVFPMNNVAMTCGVDLYFFMDAGGMTGAFRDGQFNDQTISIGRDQPTNYTCDASNFIRLTDDYSVLIGFPEGQFLKSKPSNFRPPLTVIKMCLYLKGAYSLGPKGESFASSIFQWPAAPGLKQWIKGPIANDLPSEAWVPANSRTEAVWALRQMMFPDKKRFLPYALQCTKT
jgi:hypothetical protein